MGYPLALVVNLALNFRPLLCLATIFYLFPKRTLVLLVQCITSWLQGHLQIEFLTTTSIAWFHTQVLYFS